MKEKDTFMKGKTSLFFIEMVAMLTMALAAVAVMTMNLRQTPD